MDHLPYLAKVFLKMHLCLNSGFKFYLLIKCDKQNIINSPTQTTANIFDIDPLLS